MCDVSIIFVDAWTKAYTIATIAGVIGGFVGLVVIWCQTKATQIAANAAKDSAAIAMDSQRSWLVEDGVKDCPLDTAWIQEALYEFKVIGGSPIKIVDAKFRYHLVESRQKGSMTEPNLPSVPSYGEPNTSDSIPYMGKVLAPGVKFQVGIQLEGIFLTQEDIADIRSRKKFGCAYGFIRYRDAFSKSKIRETRFCYTYDVPLVPLSSRNDERINPDRFRIGGPNCYNEVT